MKHAKKLLLCSLIALTPICLSIYFYCKYKKILIFAKKELSQGLKSVTLLPI